MLLVGGADLGESPNPYLSLRHDIEEAAVQGEGHVSEDRAAVLDDRYRLVLGAAVTRSVHTDLRRKKQNTEQVSRSYLYLSAGNCGKKKKQAKSD